MTADPIAFRDAYRTAASIVAAKATGTPATGETWTLTVKDAGGVAIGTPQVASFVGGFDVNGEGAVGYRLLDLEVVHGPWSGTGDTRTATASSRRA